MVYRAALQAPWPCHPDGTSSVPARDRVQVDRIATALRVLHEPESHSSHIVQAIRESFAPQHTYRILKVVAESISWDSSPHLAFLCAEDRCETWPAPRWRHRRMRLSQSSAAAPAPQNVPKPPVAATPPQTFYIGSGSEAMPDFPELSAPDTMTGTPRDTPMSSGPADLPSEDDVDWGTESENEPVQIVPTKAMPTDRGLPSHHPHLSQPRTSPIGLCPCSQPAKRT